MKDNPRPLFTTEQLVIAVAGVIAVAAILAPGLESDDRFAIIVMTLVATAGYSLVCLAG